LCQNVTELTSWASFYFTGPIPIRRNIYTVIFEFNLIKSRVRVKLGLGLRVRVSVFLVMHITGFLIIIIQSNCIGMDCSGKLQSSYILKRDRCEFKL